MRKRIDQSFRDKINFYNKKITIESASKRRFSYLVLAVFLVLVISLAVFILIY